MENTKKVCRAQNGGQLQSDLKYEKIFPNYAKKVFLIVMTSSMTAQGGLEVSLYIHV